MRDEPYQARVQQADPGGGRVRRHRRGRLDRDADLVLRLRRLPPADLDSSGPPCSRRPTARPRGPRQRPSGGCGPTRPVAQVGRADRHAAAEGELEVDATVRVKMRKGGTQVQRVAALDPERLLVTEWRFPGARILHEHRLEPADGGRRSPTRSRLRATLGAVGADAGSGPAAQVRGRVHRARARAGRAASAAIQASPPTRALDDPGSIWQSRRHGERRASDRALRDRAGGRHRRDRRAALPDAAGALGARELGLRGLGLSAHHPQRRRGPARDRVCCWPTRSTPPTPTCRRC